MLPDPTHTSTVQQRLVAWYVANGRDLPWRRTRDPYAILVAEVMLQQTQVERVVPRWLAWLARFPSLEALAGASVAEAIREWQGLGYNLRAVRLHGLARQVMVEHAGQLPRSVAGLQALKGVGRYTAGAVACFAYEQPVAMVDTNVRRVLGRVFALAPSEVDQVADALVPAQSAYAWNQALMDLGATLCRGQRPLCLVCPLIDACAGPRPIVALKTANERFEGSSRFYRGRIVDALRTLAPEVSIAAEELALRAAPPSARERVLLLIGQLVRDGLIARDHADGRLHLPD